MRSEVEVKLSDEKGLSREPAKGADAPIPREPTEEMLTAAMGIAPTMRLLGRAVWLAMYDAARASPIKAEVTTGEADLLREIDQGIRACGRFMGANVSLDFLNRCRASIESLARERDTANETITKMHPVYTRDELDKANAENASLRAKLAEAERKLNTPEIEDFIVAVSREAAHQIARWGYAHDRSKSAENWFWLVGYLAGKALRSAISGDRDKALHHTISSAAALANWHAAIKGDTTGAGVGQDDDLRKDNPIDARAADDARQSAQAASHGSCTPEDAEIAKLVSVRPA